MMINHFSMSRALQSIYRQKQVHWQKLLVREKEVHTSARCVRAEFTSSLETMLIRM